MRRSVSIALLLMILAPLLAPAALASVANPLPACCRGNGKHRCSVMARLRPSNQDQNTGPTVRSATEPCPYRSMLFAPGPADALGAPARAASGVRLVSGPAAILQTILQARTSETHSHHKRGPPPFLA